VNVFDAGVLLVEIRKTKYEANPWERKFLDSINYNVKMGYKLTEKQGKSLQEIYRKTQGG
jgi:hypothetical protein